MASEGQDRADALGWGRCPNRPKTFARNHTIPQKVTNVSIHDKGPEPVSHGSSDPMREAGATSTGDVGMSSRRCARPTGGSHGRTTRGPAQRRGGRKAKAALEGGPSTKRGQGQHKGRSPVELQPWRIIYALAGGSCISYRATPALSAHAGQRRSPSKYVRSSWLPSTHSTRSRCRKRRPHPEHTPVLARTMQAART